MKKLVGWLLVISLTHPAIAKSRPLPSPSPQIRPRYRMGEIDKSPSKLELVEQTLVTLLGLGIFFWAPHPHVSLTSSGGDTSVQVQK
jgi:hypothetical protein